MEVTSAPSAQIRFEGRTTIARWYFAGLAITMMMLVLAGFVPSIVQPAGRRAPLSLLAAVHGVVYMAWILLFLAQSLLVATRKVSWHKRLGISAILILPIMIALGYATCVSMARRGFDLSGDLHVDLHPHGIYVDPAMGVLFPLTDLVLFAVLAIAALFYRWRPAIHKRLMLFANIALMPAALAHLIGHSGTLANLPPLTIIAPILLLILSAVARDYFAERRVHPLTISLAVALLVSGPIRASLLGPSLAWHQFVAWLAR